MSQSDPPSAIFRLQWTSDPPARKPTEKGLQNSLDSKLKAITKANTDFLRCVQEFEVTAAKSAYFFTSNAEFRSAAEKYNAVYDAYKVLAQLLQQYVDLNPPEQRKDVAAQYQPCLVEFGEIVAKHHKAMVAAKNEMKAFLTGTKAAEMSPELDTAPLSIDSVPETSSSNPNPSAISDVPSATLPDGQSGPPAGTPSIRSTSSLSSTSRARLAEEEALIRLKAAQEKASAQSRVTTIEAETELAIAQARRKAIEEEAAEQHLGSDSGSVLGNDPIQTSRNVHLTSTGPPVFTTAVPSSLLNPLTSIYTSAPSDPIPPFVLHQNGSSASYPGFVSERPTAVTFSDPVRSSHDRVNNHRGQTVPPDACGHEQWINALLYRPGEGTTFDGKPENFIQFVSFFQNTIGRTVLDPTLRLKNLLDACAPMVRDKIEFCKVLEPEDGYSEAWNVLHSEYGNPHSVSDSVLKKLKVTESIQRNNLNGLRDLSRQVNAAYLTLAALNRRISSDSYNYLAQADSREVIGTILRRVPYWAGEYAESYPGLASLQFINLATFLKRKTLCASDPLLHFVYDRPDVPLNRDRSIGRQAPSNKRTAFAISADEHETAVDPYPEYDPPSEAFHAASTFEFSRPLARPPAGNGEGSQGRTGGAASPRPKCVSCQSIMDDENKHSLFTCSKFLDLNEKQRFELVYKNKLCLNCGQDHFAYKCRVSRACSEQQCPIRSKHSPLLHGGFSRRLPTSDSPPTTEVNTVTISQETTGQINSLNETLTKTYLNVVPVDVHFENKRISTFALLDPCANIHTITEQLTSALSLSTKTQGVKVDTVVGSQSLPPVLASFDISSRHGDQRFSLSAQVVPTDRFASSCVPLDVDLSKEFPDLAGQLDFNVDLPVVSMLIGQKGAAKTFRFHKVQHSYESSSSGLCLQRTVLGFALMGSSTEETVGNSSPEAHFLSAAADIDGELREFWRNESCPSGYEDKKGMSFDDRQAHRIIEQSTKFRDGRFEVRQPWKVIPPSMPDNSRVVRRRFESLQKKFERDNDYFAAYSNAIQKLLESRRVEMVPEGEVDGRYGKVHYLSHHGVEHVRKDLRVVFDTSLKTNGASLNTEIYTGPDLLNSLLGVLLRFRENPVAVSCDLAAFYHSVDIPSEDRDFYRFYWYRIPDNPQSGVVLYRFMVHIFGGNSSQACCLHARDTGINEAESQGELNAEEAVKAKAAFYSDDLLRSFLTTTDALRLMVNLVHVLQKRGFNLTKFCSSDREFMESIPADLRHPDIFSDSLDLQGKVTSALGLTWRLDSDSFSFSLDIKSRPQTKRQLLSCLASIYDPLGLIGFALVPAKALLQETFRLHLGWDDLLPDGVQRRVDTWVEKVTSLRSLRIPRPFNPHGDAETYQLHVFCDGSNTCYGAICFLRAFTFNGQVRVTLVSSRNRLPPINGLSVPRLELCGALLAARLFNIISSELDIEISASFFWTDSLATLGRIRNRSTRFQVFVARRLAEIQDTTNIDSWRYVPTKQNAADGLSRGSFPSDPRHSPILCGPTFLFRPEDEWPEQPVLDCTPEANHGEQENGTEVHMTHSTEEHFLMRYFPRFGSYFKLKTAIAWLIRFIGYVASRHSTAHSHNSVRTGDLTLEELRKAESVLVRLLQRFIFPEVFKAISESDRLPLKHPLARFAPFIDQDGVLRIGGRLRHSHVPYQVRHPIILPSRGHIVHLLIHETHCSLAHGSVRNTCNELRARFWIPAFRRSVKSVLFKCIPCKRYRAPLQEQVMADLPPSRSSFDPPFTTSGADLFGHFNVTIGRSKLKRWVALFTCHSSRAIHLEVVFSLDLSSFISALRRFASRRGSVRTLQLDNATNHVGADREIRRAIEQWNLSKVGQFLKQKGIKFIFNPPRASHVGGVFESCIRLCRQHLYHVLDEQRLTDEALLTIMCEVEFIVNSRPLTSITDDPGDLRALTPNDLLVQGPMETKPPGVFNESDLLRRRWRQVQFLADLFWKRFIREYLPLLNRRQKWIRPSRVATVGDLVLLHEDHMPRGCWPLGRIVKVFPSKDGYVRRVTVKTATGEYERSIHKTLLLEASTTSDVS